MSRLTSVLLKTKSFPKPETNLNFGNFSKIQPGAGANDVAGWTGESLKTGLATVDLTQTTASAQPVFDTDHIVLDGSDYLEGLPTQSGDFTYIIKFMSTSGLVQIMVGREFSSAEYISLFSNQLGITTSLNSVHTFPLIYNNTGPHILTLTRDGDDFEVYLNGVSQGTFNDSGLFRIGWLGKRGAGTPFEFIGSMYRVIIYPTALTAAEVAAKTASLV